MTNVGRDYLGCSTASKQGMCANNRRIRRPELDTLVIDALRSRMMAPELVAEFVREFTLEWNRAISASSIDRDAVARDLAAVERKLAGLIDAISEGMRGVGLQAKMDALESRKADLEAKLVAPTPPTPRLHPNLSEIYRAKVERLGEALQAGPNSQASLDAVRGLIDRVVLTPLPDKKGFEIELVGEIAAMVALGAGMPQPSRSASGPGLFESSIKVVAGTGFGRLLSLPAVAR